ncbi:unnamed protein product, partial [Ectocarpus sp. 12 AP-2014]
KKVRILLNLSIQDQSKITNCPDSAFLVRLRSAVIYLPFSILCSRSRNAAYFGILLIVLAHTKYVVKTGCHEERSQPTVYHACFRPLKRFFACFQSMRVTFVRRQISQKIPGT